MSCILPKQCFKLSETKFTYYPYFQNVRSILEECQVLLANNKEHKKLLSEVPIMGLGNGKSLKDYLVRANLPRICNVRSSEP